jgi:hypothetical protein
MKNKPKRRIPDPWQRETLFRADRTRQDLKLRSAARAARRRVLPRARG